MQKSAQFPEWEAETAYLTRERGSACCYAARHHLAALAQGPDGRRLLVLCQEAA